MIKGVLNLKQIKDKIIKDQFQEENTRPNPLYNR